MRILLVTSRFPWPPRRGNQLRTVQMAAWLASRHEVTVLAPRALDDAPVPAGLPYEVKLHPVRWRARLASAGRAIRRGWPVQNGIYDLSAVGAALRSSPAPPNLAILQLARMQGAVRGLASVPLAVDFVDSLSLNFRRRAARDHWWLRPLWLLEARLMANSERQLMARARLAWVVSARDRDAIVAEAAAEDAERLQVLPVAVGTPPGSSSAEEPRMADDGRPPTVVLTGNLGYFPTLEGALWLTRAVWPLLRGRTPDAVLRVAGVRAPNRLREAVRRCGGRLLDAPEDLGAVLAASTVAVAPLRCGSGVPIKILEAWGAGIPVLATPYAAAGTTGVAGEDFLVAESAEDWAAALARLLADRALRERLARSARQRLARDYGESVLRERLLSTIEHASLG